MKFKNLALNLFFLGMKLRTTLFELIDLMAVDVCAGCEPLQN
jgi:hypothetical protein